MENQQKIVKGLDPSIFLSGLITAGIGVVSVSIELFTSYGLRIGPIPLPLDIIGYGLFLIGIGIIIWSFFGEKCIACKNSLDIYLVAFSLKDEKKVMDAVKTLDASALSKIEKGSFAENNIQVSLYFCSKCESAGLLEVLAFRETGEEKILKKHEVSGPLLKAFGAFMKKEVKSMKRHMKNQKMNNLDHFRKFSYFFLVLLEVKFFSIISSARQKRDES